MSRVRLSSDGMRATRRIQLVGGLINPKNIPNLTLWLAADKGITLSSGKVSAWADQSGSGYNGSQPNASFQPTYVTATSYNSKPALTFVSTNFLGLGTTANIVGARTYGIVYKQAANKPASGTAGCVIGTWNGTSKSEIVTANVANVGNLVMAPLDFTTNPSTTDIGFNPVNDANIHSLITTYNGGDIVTLANYSIEYDSGAQTVINYPLVKLGITNFGSVGARATSIGSPAANLDFIGDIQEILVFARMLSVGEIALVNGYFRRKYGTL